MRYDLQVRRFDRGPNNTRSRTSCSDPIERLVTLEMPRLACSEGVVDRDRDRDRGTGGVRSVVREQPGPRWKAKKHTSGLGTLDELFE